VRREDGREGASGVERAKHVERNDKPRLCLNRPFFAYVVVETFLPNELGSHLGFGPDRDPVQT
jgi:hypothetical protein